MKRLPRRVPMILALGLASLFCAAGVELRVHHSGELFFRFLVWNLILAWVPFALALAADLSSERGHRWTSTGLGLGWLVFFPNAPYILSDFVHLEKSSRVPLWYDGLLLSAFAWTGLLLGFASLYVMQGIWRRAAGHVASWVGVVGTLALASVGIYWGRVFRLNSWDVVTRPGVVLKVLASEVAHPLHAPWIVASLAALTAALLVGYAVIYGVSGLRMEKERQG